MVPKHNFGKKNILEKNSRLNIVLAVIFLLAGMIILKLYILQIKNVDLYTALASDQHQAYSELQPLRGQIFIQDNREGEQSLYPIATNKEFALVYAKPDEIEDPEKTANILYDMFDKEEIEKLVDKIIAEDKTFYPENYDELTPEQKEEIENLKKAKKELEIENREKAKKEEYQTKLSKKGDPYEPLKNKVAEEKMNELKAMNIKGIDFIMQEHRYYPETDIGGQMIGFVGFKDEIMTGQYGLEGFFNSELSGKAGSVKAERAAGGKLIIISDREYQKPEDGSDLVLTINRSIQFETCTKLREAVLRHGADSGSVIILDPKTGAILAMCSWPDYDPNNYNETSNINIYNNPAIFYQYEPGSIFKAITMAAGLDQGKVTPETTYEDKGQLKIQNYLIKNSDFDQAGGHGVVNMSFVLESSLNTGAIFVMQKTGEDIFSDYVKKFGFGEKTGIELETEADGDIKNLLRKKKRPVEVATATFGQGLTVTPLQMVSAYAAIANGGILMKPYLVKEIIKPNGEHSTTEPQQVRRVISERASALLSGMLVNVVEKGHGKKAAVKGYYIGGKTGTAQVPKKGGGYETNAHIGSFCGYGPIDDPKFVMLVKLDNPRDVEWAESSAAPLFGEIARFILNYYQIPTER